MIDIFIENKGKMYKPVIKENVTLQSERAGTPSKLTFDVIKDEFIDFEEGNLVRCSVDNKNIFLGFVFKKERTNSGFISVTAYDQLRYLKNKDTFGYENITASTLLKNICYEFGLNVGGISETSYIIPYRVEQNKSLFDIVLTALDLTMQNTGIAYVLYDDFGKITLKKLEEMKTSCLINSNNIEDFSYSSSIDDDTYNKVRLMHKDEESGAISIYEKGSAENQKKWGVLQFFDTLEDGENGNAKAESLLNLYNRKTRKLSIKNALCDLNVRGGSLVLVGLNLGDIIVNSYMLVEKCTHNISTTGKKLMDLELVGGDFSA